MSSKTQIMSPVVVVLAVLGSLVGCSGGTTTTSSGTVTPTMNMEVSWATSYDTVGSISVAADLVITGTVESTKPLPDLNGLPQTQVTISVTGSLKGSPSGPTVDVVQTGGLKDGTFFQISDAAIPEPGEKGVYFLSGGPETYAFINGDTGKLRDIDGALVPPKTSQIKDLGGVDTVNELRQIVQRPAASEE